jgi:guanylate kinase
MKDIHFEGKIIIFSAPSGAGKTTLVKHLLATYPEKIGFSISACTRPKRSYETNGIDYYFLSIDNFQEKIDNNEFVEWQEVYPNSFYGTLKSEIEKNWNNQKHVIFDVDVKGGLVLKEYFKEKALSVFVMPPSVAVLEKRLRERNTETEESLQKRIAKFEQELTYQSKFDKVIINNDLMKATQEATILAKSFLNLNDI